MTISTSFCKDLWNVDKYKYEYLWLRNIPQIIFNYM